MRLCGGGWMGRGGRVGGPPSPVQARVRVLQKDAGLPVEVEHALPVEVVVLEARGSEVVHDEGARSEPLRDACQLRVTPRLRGWQEKSIKIYKNCTK